MREELNLFLAEEDLKVLRKEVSYNIPQETYR
jgi:hypothetical protein